MVNYEDDKNNKILKLALSRLKLRFPVAEIAKKTGYSKGNISNYIKNKKPVSDNFLENFLIKYDLSMNELCAEIEVLEVNDKEVNFKFLYSESQIEEKFKDIDDNEFGLYFENNKRRLIKNKLINSIIKKEAWVIINEEFTKEILEKRGKDKK